MLCNKCGFDGNPNLEETGPHTKAICAKCGSYIKMVGQTELDELTSVQSQLTNEQIKEELINIRNQINALLDKIF